MRSVYTSGRKEEEGSSAEWKNVASQLVRLRDKKKQTLLIDMEVSDLEVKAAASEEDMLGGITSI